MTIIEKREKEQRLIESMITVYCKGNHRCTPMCSDCQELLIYAGERIARCPHMEKKTFCSACTTPCYKPDMRAKVREVMRYAGPRMLLHHPVLLIKHVFTGKKEKVNYEA